jgi:hypothetical protein
MADNLLEHISDLPAVPVQRETDFFEIEGTDGASNPASYRETRAQIKQDIANTGSVKTYIDNSVSGESTRAQLAETANASAAAGALSAAQTAQATGSEALGKANAALPAATAESDYVKKAYTLNGGGSPTYQMLKAITWTTDLSGHLTLHAWMRDLSGVTTTDIEDDLVPPLASGTADGVMPHETFSTVQDLVTKVAALTGSVIPKGTIQEHTADVTDALLTAFVGGSPAQGWGVKDLDNVTWVYEAGDDEWVQWGDGEIAQATNDDDTDPMDPITGILGLVKGKNLDGYVFVENDGTLSVVGWSALVARVATLESALTAGLATKLDKQQDAADAGMAMVIGPDGKLIPGVAGKVDTVDGVEPGADKNVELTVTMTRAEYDALEAPVGSGLYPTLAGKTVILSDVYPDNIPDGAWDYSLDEKPVMDPAGRQKQWIDGRPIFSRTFIGTYLPPTAANTARPCSFSPGKVAILRSEGFVYKEGVFATSFWVKLDTNIPYSGMRTGATTAINISVSSEIYYDANGLCSYVIESSTANIDQLSSLDTFRVMVEYVKN